MWLALKCHFSHFTGCPLHTKSGLVGKIDFSKYRCSNLGSHWPLGFQCRVFWCHGGSSSVKAINHWHLCFSLLASRIGLPLISEEQQKLRVFDQNWNLLIFLNLDRFSMRVHEPFCRALQDWRIDLLKLYSLRMRKVSLWIMGYHTWGPLGHALLKHDWHEVFIWKISEELSLLALIKATCRGQGLARQLSILLRTFTMGSYLVL